MVRTTGSREDAHQHVVSTLDERAEAYEVDSLLDELEAICGSWSAIEATMTDADFWEIAAQFEVLV